MLEHLLFWNTNMAVVMSCENFSHDITAAILVFQNNKTTALLVYPENPLVVELFSFFCSNSIDSGHVSENAL